MNKIRILIADDHAIVRYGLASLFATQDDMEVIGQAKDGNETVRLALKLKPDIIIMDLMMPGLDGAAATSILKERQPSTKVLILTSFTTADGIAHALSAGAVGAVTKTTEDDELIPTIRRIMSGERVISPDIAQHLNDDPPVPKLSPRQHEILGQIIRGLSNDDIATALGIRSDSVRKYVKALFAKLGAANRAEAVATALRKYLLKI